VVLGGATLLLFNILICCLTTVNDFCIHYATNAAVAGAIALMTNAIASPAHRDTAGPSTTTVRTKASVAAEPSLLPIVVLNLS
jgi:hypothetical protein